LIITSAVSSPFCHVTGCLALFIGLIFWILAGAGAPFQDVLRRAEMIFRPASLSILCGTTAVASIKVAIRVIILWIAMSVAFEMHVTFFSRFQLRLFFGVQTLAHFAVQVVVFFGCATAVATVPSATAVVVFIIACFVSFPGRFMACFAASNSFVGRIFATAILAVKEFGLFPTAVSAIPIATAVVVTVVAVTVPTPFVHFTFSIASCSYRRVAAFALLAIAILVLIWIFGVSTAVSTVPVATANVVVVVTMSVSLPLMHRAVFLALGIGMDKLFIQT